MNKETETQKLNTYLMMIVKWPGSEVCFFVCLLVFLEKVKRFLGQWSAGKIQMALK